MGYLDNIEFVHTIPSRESLAGKATVLLKQSGHRKKPRRGKGSLKKQRKKQEHQKMMELYNQQKKQRAQMFQDFERLIAE